MLQRRCTFVVSVACAGFAIFRIALSSMGTSSTTETVMPGSTEQACVVHLPSIFALLDRANDEAKAASYTISAGPLVSSNYNACTPLLPLASLRIMDEVECRARHTDWKCGHEAVNERTHCFQIDATAEKLRFFEGGLHELVWEWPLEDAVQTLPSHTMRVTVMNVFHSAGMQSRKVVGGKSFASPLAGLVSVLFAIRHCATVRITGLSPSCASSRAHYYEENAFELDSLYRSACSAVASIAASHPKFEPRGDLSGHAQPCLPNTSLRTIRPLNHPSSTSSTVPSGPRIRACGGNIIARGSWPRCSIVGSAPSLLYSKQGHIIDNPNVVIRFGDACLPLQADGSASGSSTGLRTTHCVLNELTVRSLAPTKVAWLTILIAHMKLSTAAVPGSVDSGFITYSETSCELLSSFLQANGLNSTVSTVMRDERWSQLYQWYRGNEDYLLPTTTPAMVLPALLGVCKTATVHGFSDGGSLFQYEKFLSPTFYAYASILSGVHHAEMYVLGEEACRLENLSRKLVPLLLPT